MNDLTNIDINIINLGILRKEKDPFFSIFFAGKPKAELPIEKMLKPDFFTEKKRKPVLEEQIWIRGGEFASESSQIIYLSAEKTTEWKPGKQSFLLFKEKTSPQSSLLWPKAYAAAELSFPTKIVPEASTSNQSDPEVDTALEKAALDLPLERLERVLERQTLAEMEEVIKRGLARYRETQPRNIPPGAVFERDEEEDENTFI